MGIAESLEKEKITVHSRGKYEYTFTFNLNPIEGVTKLTSAGEFEMPGGVLGKALGRVGRRYLVKDIEKALVKLKSIVEK